MIVTDSIDRACAGRLACLLAGLCAGLLHLEAAPLRPSAIADEIIASTTSPENGTSPMWCVGAPLVVRRNGVVWVSLQMHDSGAKPYCNTHWELWRRPETGVWAKVKQGMPASEREPCPVFLYDPETLVLSIQPKVLEREIDRSGETAWFCQPALAVYDLKHLDGEARLWPPVFAPGAPFAQHSYRSLAVDPASRSLFLMVIDRQDIYRPTWRDAAGSWHPLAPLEFPVRACYPDIVMRERAAHILAIGDIKEPNRDWKDEKFRVLQREWDYVFRRLFYTWSPDLAQADLRPPLEVDSVDATAGWMFNLDLLVDARNRVHLLWVRRNFEFDFLRDRFFPGQPIVESIRHAVIENGRVVSSETLWSREVSNPRPWGRGFASGRLHALPDGRLVAVLATETDDGTGLFLQELDPQAQASPAAVRVALDRPPPGAWFFTNTPRGGSAPDRHLDLLGTETRDGVISFRYLQIRID